MILFLGALIDGAAETDTLYSNHLSVTDRPSLFEVALGREIRRGSA